MSILPTNTLILSTQEIKLFSLNTKPALCGFFCCPFYFCNFELKNYICNSLDGYPFHASSLCEGSLNITFVIFWVAEFDFLDLALSYDRVYQTFLEKI